MENTNTLQYNWSRINKTAQNHILLYIERFCKKTIRKYGKNPLKAFVSQTPPYTIDQKFDSVLKEEFLEFINSLNVIDKFIFSIAERDKKDAHHIPTNKEVYYLKLKEKLSFKLYGQ